MTDIVDIGPTGEIAKFSGYGITDVAGETVPSDGQPGYAPGCIFRKVNGASGANTLYRNIGTKVSCNFDSFGGAGGALAVDVISEFTANAGVTIDGVLVKDTGIFNADLTLKSTNEINLMIGLESLLAIDDAAIAGNAALTDASGISVFIETQDGGTAATTNGLDGGNFTLTAGIGTDAVVSGGGQGGSGGSISFVTQAAGAADGAGPVGNPA